jgi:hypothetical protein
VATRFGKALGTISNPEVSSDSKLVWIARVAGKRDPDILKMSPVEYASSEQFAGYEARTNFIQSTLLSDEYLKEHFALDLEVWRRQAEESKSSN